MFRNVKSLLFILLSALLIIGVGLSACAPSVEEEPVATEEEMVAEEEPLFIAFAFNGTLSDEGWTWRANQGRLAVEEAYGDRVKTAYAEFVAYSEDGSRVMEQFIADGADMVIENTGYAEVLWNVVQNHPDVAFMGMNIPKYENEKGYYAQTQFSAYLVGVAAGLMTESNQLGYLCSFPGIYTDVNAFQMGASSVNPDVITQVACINSWYDPPAARQASEALIGAGADFLFGIMDDPMMLVVAEENGVWAATKTTDLRRFGPESYVTSELYKWDDFYVEQVGKLLEGNWTGGDMELLPLGVGSDIDAWGKNVPQDVQDQVEAIRDRMLNEGYTPFVGPIRDSDGNVVIPEGETLTPEYCFGEWNWTIEGIVGAE
jgi:basic membrane lipoprotein Med (substrate-binding protein (PBP1-ABC) superfamily)